MKLLFSKFTLFFSVLFAFGVFGQTLSALPASPVAQAEKLLTKNDLDSAKALQSVVDFKFEKHLKNLSIEDIRKILRGSTFNVEFFKIVYFIVCVVSIPQCFFLNNLDFNRRYVGFRNTDITLISGIVLALFSRYGGTNPKLDMKDVIIPGFFAWIGWIWCLIKRQNLHDFPKENDERSLLLYELGKCYTPKKLCDFKENYKNELLNIFNNNQKSKEPRKIAILIAAIIVTMYLPEILRAIAKTHEGIRRYKEQKAMLAPSNAENEQIAMLAPSNADFRDQPECPYCLSEVFEGVRDALAKQNDRVRPGLCACKVWFHRGCLQAWLGTGARTCPNCRGYCEAFGFVRVG